MYTFSVLGAVAMLVPVRCYCGRAIGQYAPLYRIVLGTRVRKRATEEGWPPQRALADPNILGDMMGDILDALRLDACCRLHLVTSMRLSDYYD